MLLLSDGQDAPLREGASLPLPPGVVLLCLGFGKDHDASLLSSLSARGAPGGSFTYVDEATSADVLDETLSAFVGDASRFLSPSASLR